jgi:hypothetical protein
MPAVLVLGFAGFLVVKPDREACKTAIGAEVDVSWPCRFQSDAQLEAIGREVFSGAYRVGCAGCA